MIAQQAEHALANMTGQQLLSKFDTNNHMQTMFYQLPMLLQDQIETVNIYLNSRNDGGKLDWQNCSLYFLLDTEKYGKIGILLQALERNLTLTIKTDNEKLAEALRPLTEMAKENLEAIGYNVKGINFTKMNEQEEQTAVAETTQAKETNKEKGYDWTV
jgi:folate-dependent tRNA-U54 methylase TrmFO/GidA